MKLTPRDRALLAVVGLVAVLGGMWWFVVKPAGEELSAQRDRLEEVRAETSVLRDTVARLEGGAKSEVQRTAQRLRLAKALPESTETPGVVVQLQRLADRANVELTSVKETSVSDYGAIRGTEFEVKVTGRFFDVDDFMYRLHRQVAVDERDRPVVGGRLFATKKIDISEAQAGSASGGISLADEDDVVATLTIVAFSAGSAAAGGAGGAVPPSPAPGQPGAAVAEPAPAATAPPPAAPAAAPTSGGAQ